MGLFSNASRVSTAAINANTQFGAFGIVARILNAALTFCFGYAFGAATFDTGNPQLSAILGGVAYAFILDAAAFGWDAAAQRRGISPEQRAIADGMSSVSMWSTTIIWGVELMLTTTLVTVDATMRENIGMLALLLITGLLAAHFVRLFAYNRLSPEAIDSRIEGELDSTLDHMMQTAKRKQAEMITEQVGQYITEHTDKIVALESRKTFNHLLINMGHGDQVARPQVQSEDKGNAATAPPPPPPEDAIIDTDQEAPQEEIDLSDILGNGHSASKVNLNMTAG